MTAVPTDPLLRPFRLKRADQVVVEHRMLPNDDVFRLYRTGDAMVGRDIHAAMYDARRLVLSLCATSHPVVGNPMTPATGDRHFADDLTVDRDDVDGLLSELDEYAVEQALQISENSDDDVEVTVLTVGPEDAKDALRKALSMGADKAIHVEDDDLHGTDAIGTSLVLAKAIEKAGYDLVISGMASTDGTAGIV
uniref:electron transfer flavoprotein subunit beta/FixA family protein n=1 Tax=Streptomyces fulvoviolaceus TaxID=285535 RepID=UPI003B833358